MVAKEIARAYDISTGEHLDNVQYYSREIAKRVATHFQLSDDDIDYITIFSALHDIGKVGIPDGILLKTEKLTKEERTVIETHPQVGKEIIDRIAKKDIFCGKAVNTLYNIVYMHHERLDGSGYPKGLKGEEIPPEVRIITVADIFDAITNYRIYRKPKTTKEALKELDNEVKNGRIDPICYKALLDFINNDINKF